MIRDLAWQGIASPIRLRPTTHGADVASSLPPRPLVFCLLLLEPGHRSLHRREALLTGLIEQSRDPIDLVGVAARDPDPIRRAWTWGDFDVVHFVSFFGVLVRSERFCLNPFLNLEHCVAQLLKKRGEF